MKRILLITVALAMVSLGALAQIVNIPDANFKAYLVGNTSINTNEDTEIQVSEATAFTGTIFCYNLGISDLTGIEHFVNLSILAAPQNQLTSLDVSQNTALLSLNVQDNMLTSLDISQNTALTSLNCSQNSLSALEISQNLGLQELYCLDNNLSVLDVSQHTDLIAVNCAQNNISILDFSQNTGINQNTSLTTPTIFCQQNNLTVLKMNGISTGSLQSQNFNATSNPNLSCIEVENVSNATALWANIDATASFSLDCDYPVYIPDANFKAYLVGESAINTNGDTEIQVTEAAAFTGQINCANDNISDLTGIEAFTALTELICSSNDLTTLDLSQNIALTQLWCGSNNLSALDISQNTSLSILGCGNQNINTLNVSQNTALTYLECYGNNMSAIDISNNMNLEHLDVYNNNLSTLDLSNNSALSELYCQSNDLAVLNMKNLSTSTLSNFNATSNPNLSCIEVDDAVAASAAWTNIDVTASFSTNCNYSVSSISVQGQNNVTTISIPGGTLQMEANVLPAYADDASYTWSVTNGTGSATIDVNGLLTAVSDGTVTVTATANDGSGVVGDAEITISNQIILVNSITVQGQAGATAITTYEGTLQMEATVLPADATDATYTWSVANDTGGAIISTSGLLTAVSNGTVTVTATANDGSGVSDDVVVTISNQVLLSVNDQHHIPDLSIYPNPVSTVLSIDFDQTIEALTVIDFTGKPVKTIASQEKVFDVSDLSRGIYFLQVKTDKGLVSKKIIKQ